MLYCCKTLKYAIEMGLFEIRDGKTIHKFDTGEFISQCPYCNYYRCSSCCVFVPNVWKRQSKGFNQGQRCARCLTKKDREVIALLPVKLKGGQILASSKSLGLS